MGFIYCDYITKLKTSRSKLINEYERLNGRIYPDMKLEPWYTNYVGRFETCSFKLPDEIEKEYDWDIFMRLTAASFTTFTRVILPVLGSINEENLLPEYHLFPNSSSTIINSEIDISRLSESQVNKYFEILIAEVIATQNLLSRKGDEKDLVIERRINRLYTWNINMMKIKQKITYNGLLYKRNENPT